METPLDWSILPADLHYLIEPALFYGEFQFELRILDFLHGEMTTTQKAELESLILRGRMDSDKITGWIDEHPIVLHRESALIHFMLFLISLGLDCKLLNPVES